MSDSEAKAHARVPFVTPAGSCDSTYDLESHSSHSSHFRSNRPDVTQHGERHPVSAGNDRWGNHFGVPSPSLEYCSFGYLRLFG